MGYMFKSGIQTGVQKKFKIPKDVKLEFVFIDSQSQLDRNMNQEDQQEIFRVSSQFPLL